MILKQIEDQTTLPIGKLLAFLSVTFMAITMLTIGWANKTLVDRDIELAIELVFNPLP